MSDPQLVGERDEPRWPLGSITRWDQDRFLSASYEAAKAHAQRGGGDLAAVVFLGDLLDEGEDTS